MHRQRTQCEVIFTWIGDAPGDGDAGVQARQRQQGVLLEALEHVAEGPRLVAVPAEGLRRDGRQRAAPKALGTRAGRQADRAGALGSRRSRARVWDGVCPRAGAWRARPWLAVPLV